MRSQFTELHRQDYTDRATQGNTGHMEAEPHRRRNHLLRILPSQPPR